MEDAIVQLHPAGQVAAVIAIGAFACVAIWQIMKTLREL